MSHLGSSPQLALVHNYYRCQKSPSPRSSFPHRDPIRRWRSNSRRGSSSSTEGQQAAAAGGARGQRLRGLTMVDASPRTVPPQPGTPATPAGGWQQESLPWRPQPLPSPQRPAREILRGRVEKGKWKRGCKGWQESCSSSHWGGAPRGRSGQEEAGGRRSREQRRRFPQGCGEEEAELRSVGAGGGVPSPGSGRRRRGPAGAHPTISRPAASCPLSHRRRRGRPSGTSGTGHGGPRRRIPPDTLQPGLLLKGEAGAARSVRGEGQTSWLLPPEPEKSGRARRYRVPRSRGRGERPQVPTNRCPPTAPRASSSRPPEGSCEGGRGSAHAARSFRRRRCPNRGRPREKEEK